MSLLHRRYALLGAEAAMRAHLRSQLAPFLLLVAAGAGCTGAGDPGPPPQISLSTSSLTFSGVQGQSNPQSQNIQVNNTGGGTLSWSATSSASWLVVSPTAGAAPSALTVAPNISGLNAGSYSGTITVSGSGAVNTPQTANASLTLTPPPTIGLSATSFTFTGVQGGANPTTQTLTISNTGGSTLNWTASDDATWLTLSSTSGMAPSTVTLTASTSGLAAGTYTGTITVTGSGATNTPQTATVTLTVTPVYDGSWAGTTAQDSTITLAISGNAITQYSFGWRGTGSGCTAAGRITVTFTTPLSVASGSFSRTSSGTPTSHTITGTFSSGTNVSGTLSVTLSQSGCNASSGTFNWSATRQ